MKPLTVVLLLVEAVEFIVLSQEMQCGVPVAQPYTKRIVGGRDVAPDSWPWTVLLVDAMGMVSGTGTIVDPYIIITAAQHFDGQDYDPISVGIPWWRVYAGKDTIHINDPKESYYRIKRVIIHPGYNFTSLNNDVAVIVMERQISMDNSTRPACLPDITHIYNIGDLCYLPGWVSNLSMGDVRVKNQVSMPIVNRHICQHIYKDFFNKTEICAGYLNGGKDFCSDDVGSPLMCRGRNGVWYVQGIASSGGDCSQANLPGIFKDVIAYVAWIKSTMNATGHPYRY